LHSLIYFKINDPDAELVGKSFSVSDLLIAKIVYILHTFEYRALTTESPRCKTSWHLKT